MEPKNKLLFEEKYSMGKYLRKLKGMYNSEQKSREILKTKEKQELLSSLLKNGFKFSKITLGEFQLKNGLPYSGLISTERILSNECFFEIPRKLCLNTRIAYFSDLKVIFDENKEAFIVDEDICDDYLLLFFILFELQKGEKSDWYFFISNLPKNQGFLALWSEEELDYLEDEALKKHSKKYYEEILNEYELLRRVAKKYPEYYLPGTFTWENFSWIYSILRNRSFFGSFKYVTLMPFVDMLNHENVGVYFSSKKELDLKESQELNEENFDQFSSDTESWGEQDADECEFDNFSNINKENIDKKYKNPIILEIFSYFEEKIFSIDDEISVLFVSKLLDFIGGNENKKETALVLIEKFKKLRYDYYEYFFNIPYTKKFFTEDIKTPSKDPFLDNKWENEEFETIRFFTGEKENFLPKSQVYLNYGGYSNKKLLKIYGMTLEHNKANKVFLNFKLNENFNDFLNDYVKRKLEQESYLAQFKLKYTKFNYDLVVFFKVMNLDLQNRLVDDIFKVNDLDYELETLEKVIDYLKNLKFSKYSLEENEKLLYDKNIGYNEYFATVYKLEKQRILKLNLTLYELCAGILMKIKEGMDKNEAFNQKFDWLEKTEEEFQRHRFLLKSFIKIWGF